MLLLDAFAVLYANVPDEMQRDRRVGKGKEVEREGDGRERWIIALPFPDGHRCAYV